MMTDPALHFFISFRGEDIETLINLKRVGIDNLGLEFLGELDRRRRFSDRGRPYDEENSFHSVTCRAPL